MLCRCYRADIRCNEQKQRHDQECFNVVGLGRVDKARLIWRCVASLQRAGPVFFAGVSGRQDPRGRRAFVTVLTENRMRSWNQNALGLYLMGITRGRIGLRSERYWDVDGCGDRVVVGGGWW